MKWVASAIVSLALLLCIAPACGSSEEAVTQSPTPLGQLSAKEAESILHEYLASQIRTVTDKLRRLTLANYLSQTRKHWEVHSRGIGQPYLEITGMGFDGLQLNDSGLWRVHDVTRTIEAQNSDAQELLNLMHSNL